MQHLCSIQGQVLLVPAVVQHMVAPGDIVESNDLAHIESAVVRPVDGHAPADGLLAAGCRGACSAEHTGLLKIQLKIAYGGVLFCPDFRASPYVLASSATEKEDQRQGAPTRRESGWVGGFGGAGTPGVCFSAQADPLVLSILVQYMVLLWQQIPCLSEINHKDR